MPKKPPKKPRSPTLPFAPGSPTSKDAAQAALARAPSYARAIHRLALEQMDLGITRDEAVVAFIGRAPHTTITPRIRALVFSGLLRPNGLTRPTRTGQAAEVLVASPTDDFVALYREPPPKNASNVKALLDAALVWQQAAGQEHEGQALTALLDAAWNATAPPGQPRPTPTAIDDDDWGR